MLPVAPQAQTQAEIDLAREVLGALQENSFARNREYCGLIGIEEDGDLVATKARRGREASCRPRAEPWGMTVTHSYHTHGAYSDVYDNEVPSPDDVEGDMAEGVDGFVSTPAGRLWHIDGETGVSRLICGPRRLPWDPDSEPDPDAPVASRYTLDQLIRRFEE